MFKKREKHPLLREYAYILDECVPAKSIGRLTHVLVHKSSNNISTAPGLYVYTPNNVLSLAGEEHVKMTTSHLSLSREVRRKTIELLTHGPTWKEIEEELN